jgi:hypothetical protein
MIGRHRLSWLAMMTIAALATAAQAAPPAGKPDTSNPASSFQYRRADLGSGYATVNILKMPDRSSYAITCNCDDHSLQDMVCPTPAYACSCEPSAYLVCQ